MKTNSSTMETAPPAASLAMKAVIICEDFAFAAKSNALLRRVGRRAGVNVQWAVKCWPINSLRAADLAETALLECLDAHLIVLPARRARSTPPWVLDWLKQWAALRQVKEAALGVINESAPDGPAKPVCARLSAFVRQQELNLIIDEGSVAGYAVEHFIRFLPEPVLRVPVARVWTEKPATHRSYSYRCMGINE